MDKIFPTHTIKRGEKTSRLASNLIQFNDFQIGDGEDTPLDLPAFLKGTETDGLIVLHDDRIVFEYYDRTNTKDSVHVLMSMTKSVLGLIAGVLVQEGKLDVSNLVSTYVPEVIGTPFEKVTVRQCLDMRSGFLYDNCSLDYRKASGMIPSNANEETTDLHTFLSTFQAPAAPNVDGLEGAAFDYISVNADLMGWVFERASGKEVAELISEAIWQRIGAERDAYITTDLAGNARGAGGMCATLRDMARLAQLIVDDGNRGVISRDWIHDITYKGSREAFNAGSWGKDSARVFKTIAYRSYWLTDSDTETLMGLGIHGQLMLIDRANGIVMVKMSSQPSKVDPRKKRLAVDAFKEFQRILVEGRDGLKD